MRRLEDLARRRIVAWLAANPSITQARLAAEIGVSQTWVSQYKSGDQGADIDRLDAMARVFGHTLSELFDLRPDQKEAELLEAYRTMPPEHRAAAINALRAMAGLLAPTPPSKRRP